MHMQEKVAKLEVNLKSSCEDSSRVVELEASKSEIEARLAAVVLELEGAKLIAQQSAELAQQGADLATLLEASKRQVEELEGLLGESKGLSVTLQVGRIFAPG